MEFCAVWARAASTTSWGVLVPNLQLDLNGLNRNTQLLRDGRPNVHALGIGLDAHDQRIAGSERTPVALRLLLPPPLHGIHADQATLRQLCRVASADVAVKRAMVPELIAERG